MAKVSAVIHKSSLGIADHQDSAIGSVMRNLYTEIFTMEKNKEISKEVYRDILSLLKPVRNDGF
jgi:hypothetical protein